MQEYGQPVKSSVYPFVIELEAEGNPARPDT